MVALWNKKAALTASPLLLVALLLQQSNDANADLIAGYKPSAQVTDHAAIDLDQQLLQSLLADHNLTQASLLYNKGAHSKSYAYVTFTKGTGKINKNTAFVGTTISGKPITLLAYSDYDAGETEIKLRYATHHVQAEYPFCQVGANTEPVLHGCLTAFGTVTLDGIKSAPLAYSYNPETDNKNGRTLAGFSTAAESKMAGCGPSCPYTDYEKYYDFYGEFDYGHQYVTAALEQKETNFTNGNVDFSTYSLPALEKVIGIATLNLNVWMYVIREYEDALDDCAKGCASDQCNTDKVNAWDEGIAFYVGSLEGGDGSGDGLLSYALADELCVEFKTCGKEGQEVSGLSFVNSEIVRLSEPAVDLLLAEKCVETRVYVKEIVGLMTSTLVQALLRSTYETSTRNVPISDNVKDVARAEASAYAAAVLPILHDCSASDAEFVYQQLDYNNDKDRDYAAIKEVLEKHYVCMGITCEQVGGIWDPTTSSYKSDASPCSTSVEQENHLGLILGISLGGIAFLAVIAVFLARRKKSQNDAKSEA